MHQPTPLPDFSCSEKMIVAIYEAVKDSVSLNHLREHQNNFLVVHLLNQTRVAQYTYRSIQAVLRLYSSPGEVLAGLDIDTCCLYDGKSHDIQIREPCLCKPMLHSLPHVSGQRGRYDPRSPSYEVCLPKYFKRSLRSSSPPSFGTRSILRCVPQNTRHRLFLTPPSTDI